MSAKLRAGLALSMAAAAMSVIVSGAEAKPPAARAEIENSTTDTCSLTLKATFLTQFYEFSVIASVDGGPTSTVGSIKMYPSPTDGMVMKSGIARIYLGPKSEWGAPHSVRVSIDPYWTPPSVQNVAVEQNCF